MLGKRGNQEDREYREAVGEASLADYLHDMLSELTEQTEILRDLRNTVKVEIAAHQGETLRDTRAALDKRAAP